MTTVLCISLAILAVGLTSLSCRAAEHSALRGSDGDGWSETGRRPDFSHAGSHEGEAALPKVPAVRNVKEFGALGDGRHDDLHPANLHAAPRARRLGGRRTVQEGKSNNPSGPAR